MLKRHLFDGILISLLVGLCVILFLVWLFNIKGTKGNYAHVYRDSEEILVIDLKKDGIYEVEGAISKMNIKVSNGFIEVEYSGCKNQICVNHKAVCNINSSIICLPNKIEIRVEEK